MLDLSDARALGTLEKIQNALKEEKAFLYYPHKKKATKEAN